MSGPLCAIGDCPKETTFLERATQAAVTAGGALTQVVATARNALTEAKDTTIQRVNELTNSRLANKTVEIGGQVLNATINITGNIVEGSASVAQGAQHTAEALEALTRLTKNSVEFAEEYHIPNWCIGTYAAHFVGMRLIRLMIGVAGLAHAIRNPEAVLQVGWH